MRFKAICVFNIYSHFLTLRSKFILYFCIVNYLSINLICTKMGQKVKKTDNNSKMEKFSKNGTNVSIYEKANTVLSDFIKKWDATILECENNKDTCYLICNQFGFTKMSDLLPIFKKFKLAFYIDYNYVINRCMLVLFYA